MEVRPTLPIPEPVNDWPPIPPTSDSVPDGVRCRDCGYDIRRLARSGVCPECGLPLEDSLLGTLLPYASPVWLRHIISGITAIQFGVILALFSFPAAVTARIGIVVAVAGAGMRCYGIWRTTEVDPRYQLVLVNSTRAWCYRALVTF